MDNEEEEKSGGVFTNWFNFTQEKKSKHKSSPTYYVLIWIMLMLTLSFVGKICLVSGNVWGFLLCLGILMFTYNLAFD